MIYAILISVVILLIILIIILWKIFKLLDFMLWKIEFTLRNNLKEPKVIIGLLDSIKISIEKAKSHWFLFPSDIKKNHNDLIDALKKSTETNAKLDVTKLEWIEGIHKLIWKLKEELEISNNIQRNKTGYDGIGLYLSQIVDELEQIKDEIIKR